MTFPLIATGVFLLVLGGMFYAIYRLGKTGAKYDAAAKANEHAKKANEIDESVSRLSDADLADKLRRSGR